MRFKTLVSMVFIVITLLMSVTSAISLSEGTEYWDESTYNQTSSQSAGEGYASSLTGLQGDSDSINFAARSSGTEKASPNMFNFDSFIKDLSSHRTEEWRDFAYVDDDSTELVIGLNGAQSGYAEVSALIFESGGKLVNAVSIKGETIAIVADMPLNVVSSFVAQLQASNLVRYVEPNMKFEAQFVPNDPDWDLQWGPQKIEADYAWNTTIGDPSVLVAVIDTGIDYNHPDLAANYVALGNDWVNMDPDPMDDHGHGTHCAGIVAAELNNGIGIAGVAQVKIMAEKGLNAGGSGTADDLASAIIHAVDQGADILSNSWGGPGQSSLLYDAVKYAYDDGALIVAAAGNSATSIKLYPAAYDEVVAVTATDQVDDPAVFTSFGDWVEVAAPGVDIYSTVWDNGYAYMSGTSMSTPHVSGTAALVWSQFPSMSRDWVRAQLKFTADDLGDPGFDKYYGYGRINARKAVESAPSDHDLLISNWQRPKFVQPEDFVIYNVTIMNFGLSDETDMTVQLLVDNDVTDAASIDFLASGTTEKVTVFWNPAFEGIYNVTVWVEPVPGEGDTTNNVMSMNVNVQPISTALLLNVEPWGLPTNEDVFSKYGIPYAVFGSKDFGQINLTQFSKVIVASDQNQKFYDAMNTYRWWFEDYVSGGGMLELHAADSGWNGGKWVGTLPGGLVWNGYSAQYVTIVDPVHPVVILPNPITDAELDNWNWAVHGFFLSYPQNSRIVIVEDGTGYPAYLEFDYGAGLIVATSQTLEWAYMNGLSLILENSLLYTGVRYPHELYVTLDAPAFLGPNDSALLNATVYNVGLNTETNVEIQLLIEGSVVKSDVAQELLSGGGFTINYSWVQPAEATYNVTANAPPVPDEQFTYNNKLTRFVVVASPLISPIEGQWASYIVNYYDDTGRVIGTEYWNLTYERYVEPYKINITLTARDLYGHNLTTWMIVNTMTRFVESGVWVGMWYPGWIETDINVGSPVKLLNDVAIVNGSKVVPVGVYPIDCWELLFKMYGSQYTFCYDKVSGLWIGMDYEGYPYRVELRLTETDVPIGTPYEHELVATVEAPVSVEPFHASLLNATAYNIGLSAETDVKLSLLIDGTEVESTIIPTFLSGTSHTISYTWTPTVEATYNVTAYVQPVAAEAFTANNAATKMVRVRSIKGYILFDQTHSTDSIFMYSIWVKNMTNRGYVVDTLTVSPLTPAMLQGYDVFVIPQAYSYYSSDEISAIQSFVLNGGGLLVIGDDKPYIYSDLTRFAGITWDYGVYWGYTTDITPHKVTEGVDTVYFESAYSKIYVSLQAQGIIRDSYKNILLAVSEIGDGEVVCIADENTIIDWNIGYADNLRLANNIIDWLKSRHPVASFSFSPLDPYVGEAIGFDASASYDPNGVIVSYLWSFGDGDTASGVTAAHVYTGGGTYTVALTVIDNEGLDFTAKANVTVTRTTLEVSVDVGAIYFRGEVAEFYVLVSSLGKPVDAELSAMLYYGGAVYEDLSLKVAHIGTGLYRIPYAVSADAFPGTYALVVEVSYLSLRGVALESFLLSSTLTGWNALLVNINGTVGTLKTDIGLVKVQLDAINAKLVIIEGRTATIDSAVGVIQTDVDTINASVCSLDGTIVTINSCLGSVQQDIALINGEVNAIEGTLATIQTDLGAVQVDVSKINAKLVALNNTVATVQTDIGLVNVQLDAINAMLVSIEGRTATINSTIGLVQTDINTINARMIGLEDTVAIIQTDIGTVTTDIDSIRLKIISIDGTIATIQTTLGTITGTVTSIQGDVATIKTDVGTVKASLPPGWAEAQQQTTTPLYILLILVLIISIGTIILTFLRRKKS